MASVTLPPFHMIISAPGTAACSVSAGRWEINGRVLDNGVLAGWDYGTDIIAHREIKLDTASIREETRLGEGSVVRMCVTWSTGSSFECQELGFTQDIPLDGSNIRMNIEIPVPGASLAFAIVFSSAVVLARRGPRSGPGAAIRPGSLLWKDDYSIAIEGSGPRLPVLVVDLEPERTAWAVRTNFDWLNTHPSVGVHVLINRRREDIVKALLAEPAGERDSAVRSALFFDVGRQLIERALIDSDFVDDAPFAPQTCGLAVRNRIRALFDRGIEEVRSLRDSEPEEFNNLLQAGHSLFVVSP
jgi:hypothetical protein